MEYIEKQIAGKKMRIETGKVARQSNGSVLVSYGETTILATVNCAKEAREDVDFFPLQVEYREKHYAGGKIPGGFFKREARPGEHEILTSRVTDRPIRPLFPKGFKNETQLMITVLQSDGENNPDILAGIGASAALITSTIPWNGPIATVRVGRINGDFIINPTRSESKDSDVEMIVSGNSETTDMTFTVAEDDLERAVNLLELIKNEISCEDIMFDSNVVKVSVIGVGMRSHAGVAQTMFGALAEKGINIQVISTSEIKISVLIDQRDTKKALTVLHKEFELDK